MRKALKQENQIYSFNRQIFLSVNARFAENPSTITFNSSCEKEERNAQQKINQYNPEKFVKNELAIYRPTLRLNITFTAVNMSEIGKDGISRMRFIFSIVVNSTKIYYSFLRD